MLEFTLITLNITYLFKSKLFTSFLIFNKYDNTNIVYLRYKYIRNNT